MNQILNEYAVESNSFSRKYKSKKGFFIFQFVFSITLFILLIFYYFYTQYEYKKQEQISQKLINNFNITSLYSNNTTPSFIRTSTDSQELPSFSVIGLIEIDTIGVYYPIISEVSDEFLKIAPCRFYGPMPNQVGNLCIAGHNYNNYKFFSRLKKLSIGDKINIYDTSGNKLAYKIYKKNEINSDDFSCINQDTNGKKEITLITCNNIKNKRLLIQAVNEEQISLL